ncbi:hypothetical protein LCGC14_2207780 [marine sediment metagenome]|uniref:Uncharacterized protein n=1 Tax=marine sediment metagenome TaxID=412755 RepID=A0A0F9GAJ3_9ZZZZ
MKYGHYIDTLVALGNLWATGAWQPLTGPTTASWMADMAEALGDHTHVG